MTCPYLERKNVRKARGKREVTLTSSSRDNNRFPCLYFTNYEHLLRG
jgi:hypothetical protein